MSPPVCSAGFCLTRVEASTCPDGLKPALQTASAGRPVARLTGIGPWDTCVPKHESDWPVICPLSSYPPGQRRCGAGECRGRPEVRVEARRSGGVCGWSRRGGGAIYGTPRGLAGGEVFWFARAFPEFWLGGRHGIREIGRA